MAPEALEFFIADGCMNMQKGFAVMYGDISSQRDDLQIAREIFPVIGFFSKVVVTKGDLG
jgi:hypothetical protein